MYYDGIDPPRVLINIQIMVLSTKKVNFIQLKMYRKSHASLT